MSGHYLRVAAVLVGFCAAEWTLGSSPQAQEPRPNWPSRTTATERSAWICYPCSEAVGASPTPEEVLEKAGYANVMVVQDNDPPSGTPCITVRQWLALNEGGYGHACLFTHGDERGIGISFYATAFADSAQKQVDSLAAEQIPAFVDQLVDQPEITVVIVGRSAVCAHARYAGGAVQFQYCGSDLLGGQLGGGFGAFYTGIGCQLSAEEGLANITGFWSRLGCGDGAAEASSHRARTEDMGEFPGSVENCEVVLLPHVEWCDTKEWCVVSEDEEVDVSVLFDAPMAVGQNPAFYSSSGSAAVSDESWESDTVALCTVVGTEYGGPFQLWLNGGEMAAAVCGEMKLDGAGQGEVSSWQLAMENDSRPPADVQPISYDEAGEFRFYAMDDPHTTGYALGVALGGDSYDVLAELEPGGGQYVVSLASPPEEVWILEEDSTRSVPICHGSLTKGMVPVVGPDSLMDLTAIKDSVQKMQEGGPPDWYSQSRQPLYLDGKVVAFWAPGDFFEPLENLAACLSSVGCTVELVDVDQWPIGERFEGIRQHMEELAGSPTYITLHQFWGDGSDYELVYGAGWQQWWPEGYWRSSVRNGLLRDNEVQPEHNVIPCGYLPDPAWRNSDENVTFYRPYTEMRDDLAYGDFDEDGRPDVTVCRYPCTEADEIWPMVFAALNQIWSDTGYDRPPNVNCFVGDIAYDALGSGPFASWCADSAATLLPVGSGIAWLRQSEHPGAETRRDLANAMLGSGAELSLWWGAAASRYEYCHILTWPSWQPTQVRPSWSDVWLANSCALGDYASADRRPDLSGGPPICETALRGGNRLPLLIVGPTAGTSAWGDYVWGATLIQSIMSDRSVPVAVRSSETCTYLRDHMEELRISPRHWKTISMMQNLGWIGACVKEAAVSCAVEEMNGGLELGLSFGNPESGALDARLVVPTEGRVSLNLFDVSGRLARTLIDGRMKAGVHRLHLGDGESRGTLASGAYFGVLEVNGDRVVSRVILVR